ncbi:MAG TPA: agmatinase [Nitrospirae bacterium]|nr:N(1)-aminopropylagmatine ureohydrolase [bacterium BMS3Abin06]HDH13448.1 agmatinase [Nitrospirota bacterium]HDZ01842.1 agmatinase [Nitrospirota bacterium]
MNNNNPSCNFGCLPPEYSSYKNSDIVILPVPFDKTSSWIKGSAKGPRAIINASGNMELYDIETASEVYKKGIHTSKEIVSDNSLEMINKVQRNVGKLLSDGKFAVVLGGEHTVLLGSVKAHAEHFNNMSILHLDAHSDMRDSYEGDKYSHACVMARAKEMTGNIVSVGIRSMDSSELKNIDKKKIFYASAIRESEGWIKKVVRKLSKNVYVTIDLDVFDPSIMPSTGTPEPGGLGWYEVIDLLEHVSESKDIIGFDVAELCPNKNNAAPDFLAAKLIYKLLSFKFA